LLKLIALFLFLVLILSDTLWWNYDIFNDISWLLVRCINNFCDFEILHQDENTMDFYFTIYEFFVVTNLILISWLSLVTVERIFLLNKFYTGFSILEYLKLYLLLSWYFFFKLTFILALSDDDDYDIISDTLFIFDTATYNEIYLSIFSDFYGFLQVIYFWLYLLCVFFIVIIPLLLLQRFFFFIFVLLFTLGLSLLSSFVTNNFVIFGIIVFFIFIGFDSLRFCLNFCLLSTAII
jgi:hypothetical protein